MQDTERLQYLEKSLAQLAGKLSPSSLCGMLRHAINDHGPITTSNMSSAAKRIRGNLMAVLPHTKGDKSLSVITRERLNQLVVAEMYVKSVLADSPDEKIKSLYKELTEKPIIYHETLSL